MMTFIAAKNKQLPQEPQTAKEEITAKPIVSSNKTTKKLNKQEPEVVAIPTKKEIEQMEEIVRLYRNKESQEDSGDEEEIDENHPGMVDDEDNEQEDDFDRFELKTGGVFTREEVLKIELPKFMIKNDLKNLHVVEDKSTIMVTLMANETNQNIGKRIFGIIKNGFKEFKINFNDFEDDVVSVWEFTNPKIRMVDMGAVESHERVEPRIIVCEVEYDDLLIDKEGLV